jgi:hypothetical protein
MSRELGSRRLGISVPNKPWNHPRKIQARNDTVINSIRQIHGNSIPEGTQYWTLCGRSTGSNSEFDQVIKAKLIHPQQFYGVEINPEIHSENSKLMQGNFICGDFYTVMCEFKHRGNFRPAVVNFDSVNMPAKAAGPFNKIFRMLSRIESPTPILYIANIVLSTPRFYNRQSTIEDFMARIQIPQWAYKKWLPFNEQYYPYDGAGRTGTKMGTIVMVRP